MYAALRIAMQQDSLVVTAPYGGADFSHMDDVGAGVHCTPNHVNFLHANHRGQV